MIRLFMLGVVNLLLFQFSPIQSSRPGETSCCHDPETEARWLPLIAQNPKDYELHALHALMGGLCQKVDRGMLTLDEATIIFEPARPALVEQPKREQMEKRRKQGSAY